MRRTNLPPSVVLRDGTPADIDAVSALLLRAYAEFETVFPWPELWDNYVDDLVDVAGRWARSRLVVAERAGRIVASGDYYGPYRGGYRLGPQALEWIEPDFRPRLTFPGSWAALRCIATDPAHRREGNGRAVVNHLLDLARYDKASHVLLHSLPIMAAAMTLYENLGFRRLPERDLVVRGGRPDRLLAFLRPVGGG